MPINATARFWIGLCVTAAVTIALNALILAYFLGTYASAVDAAVAEQMQARASMQVLITQQAVAQSERTAQTTTILDLTGRVARHDDALRELATMRTDLAWLKSYLLNRAKDDRPDFGG